jgi:hypothetical protein
MSSLAESYLRAGYVVLPRFVHEGTVAELEAATVGLPTRRVHVASGGVRWDEQAVNDGHPLRDFFAAPAVVGLIGQVIGTAPARPSLRCWISQYSEGEYIDEHTDRGGSLHVLLCLRSDHDQGGALVLRTSDGADAPIVLKIGDIIIFDAATTPHRTTPLVATANFPQPLRRIAVTRYYF